MVNNRLAFQRLVLPSPVRLSLVACPQAQYWPHRAHVARVPARRVPAASALVSPVPTFSVPCMKRFLCSNCTRQPGRTAQAAQGGLTHVRVPEHETLAPATFGPLSARLRVSLHDLDRYDVSDILSKPCALFRTPSPFIKGSRSAPCPLMRPVGRRGEPTPSVHGSSGSYCPACCSIGLPGLPERAACPNPPSVLAPSIFSKDTGLNSSVQQLLGSRSGARRLLPRKMRVLTGLSILLISVSCMPPIRPSLPNLLPQPTMPSCSNSLTLPAGLPNRTARPTSPDPDLLHWHSDVPVKLSHHALRANLRRSRRGATPEPSGHTAQIDKLVADDVAFAAVATLLVRASLPPSIAAAIAQWKRSRSLVGEFLRCFVARTCPQQFAPAFDIATWPHQYALATRAGRDQGPRPQHCKPRVNLTPLCPSSASTPCSLPSAGGRRRL